MEVVLKHKPAGWIAYDDNGIIWGIGATPEEAEADVVKNDYSDEHTLSQHMLYREATAALLERVELQGGDVYWDIQQDIAVTKEEHDGISLTW